MKLVIVMRCVADVGDDDGDDVGDDDDDDDDDTNNKQLKILPKANPAMVQCLSKTRPGQKPGL